MGSFRMTHFQRRRIDKTDAAHLAHPGFEEVNQSKQTLRHQLNKAVVADEIGKISLPISEHLTDIEVFEGAIA